MEKLKAVMDMEAIDMVEEDMLTMAEDKTQWMMIKEMSLMARMFYKLMVKYFPQLTEEYKFGRELDDQAVFDAAEREGHNILNNAAYMMELGYRSHEDFLFQRIAMYEAMILQGIEEVPEFQNWMNSKIKNGKKIIDRLSKMLKSENSNGKEPGFDEEFEEQYDEWDKFNDGNKGGHYDA